MSPSRHPARKRRAARPGIAATIALAALTTFTPSSAVAADDSAVAAVIARYRAEIPELMAAQDVPGLSLVVVDDHGVVWQEGFGHTDRDGRTPVGVDTIFSVQSTSKVVTATSVMQAVDAGLLELDEPITTYLPEFEVNSAFEPHPEDRITMRMLLGHTSGLTHEAPVGNNYEPEPGDFGTHVRSISRTWLRFPVGTGYAYSNLGIDLAGHVLERVSGKPFPEIMEDSLLGPLGMERSTFDRARVHSATDRAHGLSDLPVTPPVDVAMTAAGGLWTSAADLGRFLRLQLGEGALEGGTLLDPALVAEMRTVPPPDAGATAGYALGVARTRWRAGRNLDLFSHGGGGYGFLTDLWWLPQVRLGIAVLTNSSRHALQGTLALGILHDLVSEPGSPYRDRMLAIPARPAVVEPDPSFVPPDDLAARIADAAAPASGEQPGRWAEYAGLYRTGEVGAMDPTSPPSEFLVLSGVPYFDAAEDGTPVRWRLTEVEPGVFLSDAGETLDLRGPSPLWRGIDLHRVTGGPLTPQWVLLVAVAAVAATWLAAGCVRLVRRRARAGGPARTPVEHPGLAWRGLALATASGGAFAALLTVVGVAAVPGLVDVGFLGGIAMPLVPRLAVHLPLAVVVLAAALVVLVVADALLQRRVSRSAAFDLVLCVALSALAVQLTAWHLVGWGF